MNTIVNDKIKFSIKQLIHTIYSNPESIKISPKNKTEIKVNDNIMLTKWPTAHDGRGYDELWLVTYSIDGKIVSYATCNFGTVFVDVIYETDTTLDLMDIWTDPDYRNFGYARACVQALKDAFIEKERSIGSDHVFFFTYTVTDKELFPFFQKLGFEFGKADDGNWRARGHINMGEFL